MAITITSEQLEDYQARRSAAASSNDGNVDLEASYWVGYCYFRGTGGVERDDGEAARIWLEALRNNSINHANDQHDKTGKLQCRMGMIAEDEEESQIWLRQAVPRLQWEAATLDEDSEAKYLLAECLSDTCGLDGMDDDVSSMQLRLTQAWHWYQAAAEQGHFDAQCALAICYTHGRGMEERNLVQAFYWYERAAEQGDGGALFNLALCYANGRGVARDLVRAVECYDAAISCGGITEIASSVRQYLLNQLDDTERDRVMGCVQRNKWIQIIQQQSVAPSLGVWALILGKMAIGRNRWAGISPTFLALLHIIPQLQKQAKD